MPGSNLTLVAGETVIASEATTKNQPPEADIIMFQMSHAGIANGTSRRQNFRHGDR